MKEGTRQGIGIASKKEEKLPVSEEDENKFSDMGLLGKNSAKALLNVVYSYNGKLWGLRSSEHWNICLNNCEIGDNYIRFEENVSKTLHGGLLDRTCCKTYLSQGWRKARSLFSSIGMYLLSVRLAEIMEKM